VAQVQLTIDKVARELFENDWMSVPELEIRHASDWQDGKK
jgi:hypothetical protein